MSQTQTLILSIGALQGFFLFALLISDKRVTNASKLLGLQCLFIGITLVLPIIVSAGQTGFAWTIGLLLFLPASYGALSYLYCRTAITDAPFKGTDLLHLLPLAFCYLLNYEILFSPEKALSFVTMADSPLLSYTLTKIIFYGQGLGYAVALIVMVRRYQIKARQTLSSYNPDIFKWLWSLMLFIALIWALKSLFIFIRVPTVNILADYLLVIMVYFIAIVQWRNPSLFHIQQLSSQLEEPRIGATPNNKPPSDGSLNQDTRSSIMQLVQDQVSEKALYRNSELTLATLAEQVGVSMHHLSEALNQFGGKNFNRFINEYRVAEVCAQLDQKSERNLIDLALDAGFSSKSSFNAIFKKLTGQTPSQYRQQEG